MTDWEALYRGQLDALETLGSDLGDDQLATVVPASPAWTVADVYRHLAGVSHDNVAPRMDDAPGTDWTARHVAERADQDVDAALAELRANADGIAELISENPAPAVVWDVVVHHADIREALGLGALPAGDWEPIIEVLGPRMFAEQPVSIRSGSYEFGSGETVLEIEPYELFRVLFSRRSRSQIAEWAGEDLDPAQISVFGPRDDDQPRPA